MRKPLQYYIDKANRERKNAYMLVNVGDGIFERLHRLVWFDSGREIPEGYEINHKNRLRWDNRIENLELISHSEHARLHSPEKIGRKKSPEACLRMSAAQKKRFSDPEKFKNWKLARWGI
jgi:hypothetical protein